MQFIIFTFIYSVISILCSCFTDNLLIATAANAIYAALLLIYYHTKRQKQQDRNFIKRLFVSLPLLVFTIANLTTITRADLQNIILLTICAVTEELLFRGFLHLDMSKHTAVVYTLVSSILFCLYHWTSGGGYMQLICSLCFSLALSSYMYNYKSILPCIIAHAMTNLTSHSTPHSSILIICSVVCIIYSIIILRINSKKAEVN